MLQQGRKDAFYKWQRDQVEKEPPVIETVDEESSEEVIMEQFFREFEYWSKRDMNIYDQLRLIDVHPLQLDGEDPEYIQQCL